MDDPDKARDRRVREWKRLSVDAANDMDRWNYVYQLVLAERNEARSKEAREIANALCMSWSMVEARLRPIETKA